MNALSHSFPPIIAPQSRVLILGSLPGQASLAAQQYYAHPRNAFWPILGTLLGFAPEAPYAERVGALQAHGIALWDVIAAGHRPGSLDSNIDAASVRANAIAALLDAHPGIGRILFNGATAASQFARHVQPTLRGNDLLLLRLPSTSPAHAGMPFERKLTLWREALEGGLPALPRD